MKICNTQAGPKPYERIPYEEDVLLWYATLSDHIIKQHGTRRLTEC